MTDINETGILGTLLSADATLSGIVGDRIYPLVIPQGKGLPALTVTRNGERPGDTKSGVSRVDTIEVQVSAFSKKYKEASDIAGHLRRILDKQNTTATVGQKRWNVPGIRYDGSTRMVEEENDVFHIAVQFTLRVSLPPETVLPGIGSMTIGTTFQIA